MSNKFTLFSIFAFIRFILLFYLTSFWFWFISFIAFYALNKNFQDFKKDTNLLIFLLEEKNRFFRYSEFKDFVSAAKHVTSSLKITAMRFGPKSVEAAQEMFKLGTLYFNSKMIREADKFLSKALEIHRELSFLDPDEHVKAHAMRLTIKSLQ